MQAWVLDCGGTGGLGMLKNLLVLAVLTGLVFYLAKRFPEMAKGTDFPDFYAAARMAQEGAGHQLYSAAAQREFQIRYTGRVGTYFIHPPFEALLYLPFAQWPLERAYALWSLFNIGLLLAAVRVMAGHVAPRWDWQLLAAATLLFAPVLLNFIQGQDSVLLLFLLVLVFAALKRERWLPAGVLLACGLFKFHLVVPLAVVFLFGKRWRLLGGFAVGAILLALVSAAISGWEWFRAYPRFLAELAKLPMAGIHPEQMANLRGLGTLLFPPAAWGPLTLICSLAVLGWAIWSCNRAGTEVGFATAMLSATLVSYHLSPHDLSVLLLPMGVVVSRPRTAAVPRWLRWIQVATIAILFLPPLHLLLLEIHAYGYAGILTIVLFIATCASPGQHPKAGLQVGAS